jgi:hypothetical protein
MEKKDLISYELVRLQNANADGEEIFYYLAFIEFAGEELKLSALSAEALREQVERLIAGLQLLRASIILQQFEEDSVFVDAD